MQSEERTGYSTSATLLARACQEGEDMSWEEVYRRYHRLIRHVAREKGIRCENDLDDIVQSVFVTIYRKGFHYDPAKGKFRNYLCEMARRKTLEFRRRNSPVPGAHEPLELDTGLAVPGRGNGKDIGDIEALHCALREIRADEAPKHVRVLELLLEGFPVESICRETGLKANHVYVIKHRILTSLRKQYRKVVNMGLGVNV
jgi:RNA polymerase sigma-70 factor (ECF subfamily)